MAPEAAPQELDTLLNEKQKHLKDARRSDLLGAGLRTGIGAMGGFVTGVSAVIGGFIALAFDSVRNFEKRHGDWLARHSGTRMTPEAEKELEACVAHDLMQAAEHGDGLAANLVRHSGGWVCGLTAGGAALGLAWQMHRQKEKAKSAKHDEALLESVKSSWVERTSASRENPVDGPYKSK